MDSLQGRAPGHEVEPIEHRFRQRVGVSSGPAPLQRLFHERGDVPGVQTRLLGLRIHRDDPAGLVTHQIDDGVGHLPGASIEIDLAVHQGRHTDLQLTLPPGLVEERERELSGGIAEADVGQRPAVADTSGRHLQHLAEHGCLFAFRELVDAGLARAIEISPRIVLDQVEQIDDVGGAESLSLLGTDTSQPLDRQVRQLAEGERRIASGHAYSRPK